MFTLLLEIFDLSKQFQIHKLISIVTVYNIQKGYHHYVTGEKTRGSKTVHNFNSAAGWEMGNLVWDPKVTHIRHRNEFKTDHSSSSCEMWVARYQWVNNLTPQFYQRNDKWHFLHFFKWKHSWFTILLVSGVQQSDLVTCMCVCVIFIHM